jgi:hypothetical protein
MKLAVLLSVIVLLAFCSLPAQASSFLRIDVSGTTLTCDNSSAAGVTACTAAGFSTALGGNTISFTGVVNGVVLGAGAPAGVQITGNSPGTAAGGFILGSETALLNASGLARTITIDFSNNNFTLPTGASSLSASETADWTFSGAGDAATFTAWLRADNTFTIPGGGAGGAVIFVPTCTSAGGSAQACSQQNSGVAGTAVAPYGLTGRQVITLSSGTLGTYSATMTLTPTTTSVPEPSSILLLGTGVLMFVGRQLKSRKR